MTIISSIIGVIILKKIFKYNKIIKENNRIVPETVYDYYREIPNEDTTPAEAAFLCGIKSGNKDVEVQKIISSTMLDLCLKKYIKFEILDEGKKKSEIKIILVKDTIKNNNLLKDHENSILSLFNKIDKDNKGYFTMKDFEKYARKKYKTFLDIVNSLNSKIKSEQELMGNYDEKLISKAEKYSANAVMSFLAMIVISGITLFANWMVSIAIVVLYIIFIGESCKLSYIYKTLTRKGENEAAKWIGLKNYMKDFSLLDERELPEISLWEKYLAYATAFGIADKVLKQLKIKYPQISEDGYLNNTSYLYLMCGNRGLRTNIFMSTINRSIAHAYSSSVSAKAVADGYSYSNFSSGSRRRRRFFFWRRLWPEVGGRRRRQIICRKYKIK